MKASYIVWGVWFAAFVALEIPAAFGITPWRTLSTTAWNLEGLASAVKVIFLAGLVVLTVHIVAHWP